MLYRIVISALAVALLALSAFAGVNDPVKGIDVVLVKKPAGSNVVAVQADGKKTAFCGCGKEFVVAKETPVITGEATFYCCSQACYDIGVKDNWVRPGSISVTSSNLKKGLEAAPRSDIGAGKGKGDVVEQPKGRKDPVTSISNIKNNEIAPRPDGAGAQTNSDWMTQFESKLTASNAVLMAKCTCGKSFEVSATSPQVWENGAKIYCCSEACHAQLMKDAPEVRWEKERSAISVTTSNIKK